MEGRRARCAFGACVVLLCLVPQCLSIPTTSGADALSAMKGHDSNVKDMRSQAAEAQFSAPGLVYSLPRRACQCTDFCACEGKAANKVASNPEAEWLSDYQSNLDGVRTVKSNFESLFLEDQNLYDVRSLAGSLDTALAAIEGRIQRVKSMIHQLQPGASRESALTLPQLRELGCRSGLKPPSTEDKEKREMQWVNNHAKPLRDLFQSKQARKDTMATATSQVTSAASALRTALQANNQADVAAQLQAVASAQGEVKQLTLEELGNAQANVASAQAVVSARNIDANSVVDAFQAQVSTAVAAAASKVAAQPGYTQPPALTGNTGGIATTGRPYPSQTEPATPRQKQAPVAAAGAAGGEDVGTMEVVSEAPAGNHNLVTADLKDVLQQHPRALASAAQAGDGHVLVTNRA